MKTCPYCGTKVNKEDHHEYYCEFCVMNIPEHLVQVNGERLTGRSIREFALESDLEKTTPELMLLSNFELLYLLKIARKLRSDMYNNMTIFRKAGEEVGNSEYKSYEDQTGEEYEKLTRKLFVIENILFEREVDVPSRMTESFLAKYKENVYKKKRPMIINRQRKDSNSVAYNRSSFKRA
ncbi:hypothetical protein COJ90_21090 [Priestia megaterium]|uniref:hypothetical protein n=1 Tax=Priestia megaterium TaxID=1404 RepID=UPI000BF72243|nr:hypothetical protein [Priestia megaterium]PFP09211.1 hypothetical protein COJ90_21090 [Priestia megaterium]